MKIGGYLYLRPSAVHLETVHLETVHVDSRYLAFLVYSRSLNESDLFAYLISNISFLHILLSIPYGLHFLFYF